MTDPVQTWVVESGKPKWVEVRMTVAEEDSAAKPCGVSMSVRPLPRVRMTRQPPM